MKRSKSRCITLLCSLSWESPYVEISFLHWDGSRFQLFLDNFNPLVGNNDVTNHNFPSIEEMKRYHFWMKRSKSRCITLLCSLSWESPYVEIPFLHWDGSRFQLFLDNFNPLGGNNDVTNHNFPSIEAMQRWYALYSLVPSCKDRVLLMIFMLFCRIMCRYILSILYLFYMTNYDQLLDY